MTISTETPIARHPIAVLTQSPSQTSADAQDTDWELVSTAAILDLVLTLGQAEDLQAASRQLASELKHYLKCECVIVGLRRNRRSGCPLAAVSDVMRPVGRSDTLSRMEASLDEAVLNETLVVWPGHSRATAGFAQALGELAKRLGSDGAISIPMAAGDGTLLGAIIYLGSIDFAHSVRTQRFVQAAAQAVGTALSCIKRAQGGPLRRAARRLVRVVPRFRTKLLLAIVLLSALVMFIPVPYHVSVDCELQPVIRRFVAAPHAGEFQKSLVKPGDLVVRNQLLGRMDGRDIRFELAGLVADRQRAHKSHDVNLASGKTAAAQIDLLEVQRHQVRGDLLEQRLAHLDIRSPIDGIVVSGDLQRSEGIAVSIGQVLYEIAPLSRLTVELAIPDEEVCHVQENMAASIYVSSNPTTRFEGKISRIQPRSVTREKDNVFIAEVELDNPNGLLRPGMKGHARIGVGRHCLGWVLFHKPWNYLRSWLDV